MSIDVAQKKARELSESEGMALLNDRAERYLGMDGATFLRAWKAKEFKDTSDPRVLHVAILIPFVGQNA